MMGYQCLLRKSRLSPRSLVDKPVCLPKDQMRILDGFWRGKESHTLLCGQFHYTRSTIGVGMAVEAISTWNQKLKANRSLGWDQPHQADRSYDQIG